MSTNRNPAGDLQEKIEVHESSGVNDDGGFMILTKITSHNRVMVMMMMIIMIVMIIMVMIIIVIMIMMIMIPNNHTPGGMGLPSSKSSSFSLV